MNKHCKTCGIILNSPEQDFATSTGMAECTDCFSKIIEKAKAAARAAYAAHKEAAKNYGSNSQEAYDTYGAYVKAQDAACAEEAAAQIHTCAPNCKTCGDPLEDGDIQYCNGECASCIEKRAFSQDESNIGFADKYCDE